jgi:hypothetical protein
MKRIYIIPILMVFLLTTCEERERSNPLDPETELDPSEWAPNNLQAEVIDDSQIKLTWAQEDERISGFKISRKAGSGSFAQIAEVDADVTEYTDTGLDYGTDYTYRVKAFTALNESDYVTSNTTTMSIPSPTSLIATPIDDQSIQLTWNDNCSFEDGYRLERSEGGVSFTQVADLGENIVEYTDTDLALGTDYTYRVKAFTALNESGHNETTVNFWQDCDGEWGGTAVEDCAGECNGTAVEDCNGDCDGTAFENECGCVEGNTGLESDFCYGCTDPNGSNYNSYATIDDGTCFILMDFESGDDFSDWTLDGDWSISDGSDYSSSFSDVFSGSYCAWSFQIGAWSTTIESSMLFTLTMGTGGSISFYYMGRNSSYGSFSFFIDGMNQNLPSTYDYSSGTHGWQYIELDLDSGTHEFEWRTSCGSANYSSEFMVDLIHFQWNN